MSRYLSKGKYTFWVPSSLRQALICSLSLQVCVYQLIYMGKQISDSEGRFSETEI